MWLKSKTLPHSSANEDMTMTSTQKISNLDQLIIGISNIGFSQSRTISSMLDQDFAHELKKVIKSLILNYYPKQRHLSLMWQAVGGFLGFCSSEIFGESIKIDTKQCLDLLHQLVNIL